MTAHNRKLRNMVFELDGVDYAEQLTSCKMTNNTDDPEITYTLKVGGEFADDADPSYAFDLSFVSDWTASGISTYLTEHGGEQVPFVFEEHTDLPTDHVRWAGQIKLKRPDVGGDARATEKTDITLAVVGEPDFSRP